MYYVYILYSETKDSYYIGQTNNRERRTSEHELRTGRYTSGKGPWKIVYQEEFETRSLAMRREKFLKTGKGREYWKDKLKKPLMVRRGESTRAKKVQLTGEDK